MTSKYTAQCACGAVKFGFNTDPDFIANCHCLDCKRASGGEMATFFAIPQEDFTLSSGAPKGHVYVAASGKKLQRNFCPECGSRLFTSNLESFSGPCLRDARQPGPARIDRAKARDVHQTPAEMGKAARHAAVRRHARLSEAVCLPT
jgi:hypothetical protein